MDHNPFDDRQLFMTRSDLIARGWSRGLIKHFLPFPDRRFPVNHWKNYAGQDAYARSRIWHIEQSHEFEEAFKRRWSKSVDYDAINIKLSAMRAELHLAPSSCDREYILLKTCVAEAARYLELARKRGLRTPHK